MRRISPLMLSLTLLLVGCQEASTSVKQSSTHEGRRQPKSLQGQQIQQANILSEQADLANEQLEQQSEQLFDE